MSDRKTPAVQDQEQPRELFRMEKSVMTKSNFDELGMVSGDAIPEALLEYICYEHQYNIFGYGMLDPVEFARMFRFSYNYLTGKHDSPYQFQLRKILKRSSAVRNRRLRLPAGRVPVMDVICESRIENALFILANYALDITSTAVLEDQTLVRQFGFLRVLDSFTMIQDGRTGKVRYAYKLADNFRRNLSSMYLTTSRDSLVSLRRSGLGALYVFLLKLRDALFASGRTSTDVATTPDFEYLCNLAGVPAYDDPKYRKRDLNQALKKVQKKTEIDFTVEWVRGSGRQKYTPLFFFSERCGVPVSTPDSRYVRVCRDRERVDIAVHEFKHNLVEACPFDGKRYSSRAEDFFFEWIRSEDPEQFRLMAYALEKTFVNIGCGIPADIGGRIRVFQQLARVRPRSSFDDWLREIFNGQFGYSVPAFRCIEDRKQ